MALTGVNHWIFWGSFGVFHLGSRSVDAPRKMTYSIGLTYGAGLLTGGFYGGLLGIRQGGATPKLFLNSVLNSCSRYGPALANQSAIITMYYAPWT